MGKKWSARPPVFVFDGKTFTTVKVLKPVARYFTLHSEDQSNLQSALHFWFTETRNTQSKGAEGPFPINLYTPKSETAGFALPVTIKQNAGLRHFLFMQCVMSTYKHCCISTQEIKQRPKRKKTQTTVLINYIKLDDWLLQMQQKQPCNMSNETGACHTSVIMWSTPGQIIVLRPYC